MKTLSTLVIAVIFHSTPAFSAAPQTQCDLLAAHPSDTQKAAPGVEQENFDIPNARTACREALDAYPEEGRFAYQYGRSFFYEGDYVVALPYFKQAAATGHAQGQLVLGLVLMGGYAGEPEVCEAGRWWLEGARQTHLYSRIYLLQNWIDGLFEDCGLDLTESEAAQMIEDAEMLVTTDQARDDLDQLKDAWATR